MKENSEREKGADTDKSYYSQLKPNFTETVNWITCQSEVDELKKIMDKFVSKIKRKYKDVHHVNHDQTYISSNLPIETARKHHGCTGWKQSKKRKK